MSRGQDILQGTLDLLILQSLRLGPLYGWGIAQRIRSVSKGVLEVNQGSLYPSLHRLEHQGWIESRWQLSETQRRVKVYSLTPTGLHRLESETESWRRFTGAVELLLQAEPAGGA